VLAEGRAERLSRAGDLAKDSEKDKLPELLEEWLGWWRDVLLVQNGDGTRITNVDRSETLRRHASAFTPVQVENALEQIRLTAQYLNQNVNARLAIEVLLLSLPLTA
jgi:DNA polymerase-3 subunit delta'